MKNIGVGGLWLTRNPEKDLHPGRARPREGPVSYSRWANLSGRAPGGFHSTSHWPVPTLSGLSAMRCPAAARNLEESLPPTPSALDSSDASDRWEFLPPDAETRQRNVYTLEPALETPGFPNIAMRPTERNTQDHPIPRGGRAPQISPVQTSPALTNSRSRTRSC